MGRAHGWAMKRTTLQAWLDDAEMEPHELALLLRVSRQAVHQWLSGQTLPSAEMLAKLEEVSDGRVTARSFVEVVRE